MTPIPRPPGHDCPGGPRASLGVDLPVRRGVDELHSSVARGRHLDRPVLLLPANGKRNPYLLTVHHSFEGLECLFLGQGSVLHQPPVPLEDTAERGRTLFEHLLLCQVSLSLFFVRHTSPLFGLSGAALDHTIRHPSQGHQRVWSNNVSQFQRGNR